MNNDLDGRLFFYFVYLTQCSLISINISKVLCYNLNNECLEYYINRGEKNGKIKNTN